MPVIEQNAKDKIAVAALKGVSENMKAVLDRQQRLESLLKSLRGDLEIVARPFTQYMLIEAHVVGKWEKLPLTDWVKGMQKRIDEVL